MKVIVHGCSSEAHEMNEGVVQVSHLVQIQFLLYINDAYAHDTMVFECTSRNYEDQCMVIDLFSHLDLIIH